MTSHNNPPNIAYFAMRRTLDREGHIGAALVVDGRGILLEFRCTEPVRPSAVQTALYGASIQDFIAFELCGQQLLGALITGPSAWVVESETELGLQDHARVPVLHISRTATPAEDTHPEKSIYDRRSIPNNQREEGMPERYIHLNSAAGFAPVSVGCRTDWSRIVDDFLPDLRSLFSSIDLVEPFERITAGCRLLCQQDERFK